MCINTYGIAKNFITLKLVMRFEFHNLNSEMQPKRTHQECSPKEHNRNAQSQLTHKNRLTKTQPYRIYNV